MKACGITDVGLQRHENQDTFAVEQGKKLLIAVVCDGMGGAEGGQIASSVAVETFMKEMRALIRADMTAEQLRDWARMMEIEFVHITKDTTVEGLEHELFLNDLAWKLKN